MFSKNTSGRKLEVEENNKKQSNIINKECYEDYSIHDTENELSKLKSTERPFFNKLPIKGSRLNLNLKNKLDFLNEISSNKINTLNDLKFEKKNIEFLNHESEEEKNRLKSLNSIIEKIKEDEKYKSIKDFSLSNKIIMNKSELRTNNFDSEIFHKLKKTREKSDDNNSILKKVFYDCNSIENYTNDLNEINYNCEKQNNYTKNISNLSKYVSNEALQNNKYPNEFLNHKLINNPYSKKVITSSKNEKLDSINYADNEYFDLNKKNDIFLNLTILDISSNSKSKNRLIDSKNSQSKNDFNNSKFINDFSNDSRFRNLKKFNTIDNYEPDKIESPKNYNFNKFLLKRTRTSENILNNQKINEFTSNKKITESKINQILRQSKELEEKHRNSLSNFDIPFEGVEFKFLQNLKKFNQDISTNDNKTNLNLIKTEQLLIKQIEQDGQENNLFTNSEKSITYDFKRKMRKYTHVFDSLSEEEHNATIKNHFVIHKDSYLRYLIHFLVFCVVIYTLIITPLKLIFIYKNSIESVLIEILIDLTCIIDLFSGFFQAYHDFEENYIQKFEETSYNYLKNYFLIDLISAIPLNSIYELKNFLDIHQLFNYSRKTFTSPFIEEKQWNFYDLIIENKNSIFHLSKLIRLMKISKVYFDNEILKIILDYLNHEKPIINTIRKFSILYIIFLFISHILTCIYIFLGSLNSKNWVLNINLKNANFSEIYLASFYFHHTTIFSIGYGDILSRNRYEMIYNNVLMIVGVFMYSFALTSFSNMIKQHNKKYKYYEKSKDYLNDLTKKYDISFSLYKKISQHLIFLMKKNQKNTSFLINDLPLALRNELFLDMGRDMIKNCFFFKEAIDNDFLIQALKCLKPTISKDNDILIKQGDFVEEVIFIQKGLIQLETILDLHLNLESYFQSKINISNNENDNEINPFSIVEKNTNFKYKIMKLRRYDYFGDGLIIDNQRSPLNLKTISKTAELYLMNKFDLLNILKIYPEIFNCIYQQSNNLMNKIEESINIAKLIAKENLEKSKLENKKSIELKNKIKTVINTSHINSFINNLKEKTNNTQFPLLNIHNINHDGFGTLIENNINKINYINNISNNKISTIIKRNSSPKRVERSIISHEIDNSFSTNELGKNAKNKFKPMLIGGNISHSVSPRENEKIINLDYSKNAFSTALKNKNNIDEIIFSDEEEYSSNDTQEVTKNENKNGDKNLMTTDINKREIIKNKNNKTNISNVKNKIDTSKSSVNNSSKNSIEIYEELKKSAYSFEMGLITNEEYDTENDSSKTFSIPDISSSYNDGENIDIDDKIVSKSKNRKIKNLNKFLEFFNCKIKMKKDFKNLILRDGKLEPCFRKPKKIYSGKNKENIDVNYINLKKNTFKNVNKIKFNTKIIGKNQFLFSKNFKKNTIEKKDFIHKSNQSNQREYFRENLIINEEKQMLQMENYKNFFEDAHHKLLNIGNILQNNEKNKDVSIEQIPICIICKNYIGKNKNFINNPKEFTGEKLIEKVNSLSIIGNTSYISEIESDQKYKVENIKQFSNLSSDNKNCYSKESTLKQKKRSLINLLSANNNNKEKKFKLNKFESIKNHTQKNLSLKIHDFNGKKKNLNQNNIINNPSSNFNNKLINNTKIEKDKIPNRNVQRRKSCGEIFFKNLKFNSSKKEIDNKPDYVIDNSIEKKK